MYNNLGSIINSQLSIGKMYCLKFPRSPVTVVFKLFAKYDTTMPHQVLYTFKDMFGNNINFTNGVFKNMKVTEYVESPPVMKRIDTPPVMKRIDTPPANLSNDHICIPLGLPSDNKIFVPKVISIETYIENNDDCYIGINNNLPIGLNKDLVNLPIGLNNNLRDEDDLYH
jgi:hypothetical protein